jgi:hypothetical protein
MNNIRAEIRQLKATDRNYFWLIQSINDPSIRWTDIVRRIDDADLDDIMEKFMRSNGSEEQKDLFIKHCENMQRECIKGIIERENALAEKRKRISEDPEAQHYYAQFLSK